MTEKKLGGHDVEFYDSIEDLPIRQFHRYGKFMLVEGGIGDTIQDIDRHINRVISFLDDKKKATQELLNLRHCLYAVATEQDLGAKTTLCLVKSVDGEPWVDFSDSGIEKLYELLCSASVRELTELASRVRNAIDENLIEYFPHIFEDGTQKNFSDLLRKKALLQITSIVKGEDNKEEIAKIDASIHKMHAPKAFMGEENAEIAFDKQFEDLCLAMAKEFGGGIKQYTTMEFYSAYERLEKQNQELKKIRRKHK